MPNDSGRRVASIGQLDTALHLLLGRIRRNENDFAACELALHTLNICRRRCDPVTYANFLLPFVEYERALAHPSAILEYGFEALSFLVTVLGDFERPKTDVPVAGRETARALIHRRLAWFYIVLGEENEALRNLARAGAADPAGEAASMRRELIEHEDSGGGPGMDLPFVMQPPKMPDSAGLGKMARATSGIVLTSEYCFLKTHDPAPGMDGGVFKRDDPFYLQLIAAIRLAERLYNTASGWRSIRHYRRQIHFGFGKRHDDIEASTAVTGGSAGLGLSLLALAALSRLKMANWSIRIRSAVSCTGGIDDEGNILPVEDSGIGAKVRAAFYSPCRYFAVPVSNRARANETLHELKREHPSRGLEIVEFSNIREVIADTRIVETRPVSPFERFVAWASRNPKHMIVATASAAALLMFALLLAPRYADEAVRCELRGSAITFINRFGVEFNTFDLPYRIARGPGGMDSSFAINGADSVKAPWYSHRFFRQDIAPGNGKEILFVAVASNPVPATGPAGTIHIHLFSSKGKELHHWVLWDSLQMNEEGNLKNHTNFELNENELHDFDGDGMPELLILTRNHENSPMAVVVVYLKDGSYRTFRHYGHYYAYMIRDIEGDGTDEIILAAVHGKPLNASVVAIIDPEHMEGTTPVGLDPYFIPSQEDVAVAYIKLPESVMCDLLSPEICERPHAVSVNADSLGGAWFGSAEGPMALKFHFDSSWRCIGIDCTGRYSKAYNEYGRTHDLKPLEEYFEDLRGQVEYWNGSGWTRQVIVRSHDRDSKPSGMNQ